MDAHYYNNLQFASKRLKLLLYCFCAVLSLVSGQRAIAQISGIVNHYQPVLSVNCTTVTLPDASAFSSGNRVLIIQMKGAEINTTDSPAFGSIQNYNNCGNYEFAVIAAVNGNTVTLQNQLLNSYTVSGLVQMVLVPQYTDITVNGLLTAQNWNGSTGGVLAIEVSGILTLNAPVSLSGTGFRGAFLSDNIDGGCSFNNFEYFHPITSGLGAEKGEGIATVDATMNGGRGALANGGGGGNKHNTGGGGGSNAGAGGRGGDEASWCWGNQTGGEGGRALDYTLNRLFLGGGGGSPDHNNWVGTPGTNGGGIVIIRANTIQANNSVIESNGLDVALLPNNDGDGAGGGGAGGTIVLDVQNFNGNLTLRSNGGDGGDQQTNFPACFGPGGGGGTGAIILSSPTLPPNVTAEFIPGEAGIDLEPNSDCFMQTHGAEPGDPFSPVLYSVELPESTTPPATFNMGTDIITCNNNTIIDPAVNATSYLWSTGATTPTIQVTTSGNYWLSVTLPGSSCLLTDTIQVSLGNLMINAGADQTICAGMSVILDAVSPNATNLVWNNGVNDNVAFTPNATTTYTVTGTDLTGCTGSDQVTITVLPPLVVSATPSVVQGCAPLSVTFDNTTPNGANCVWTFSNGNVINGCGDQTVLFENPGCFDLTLAVTSVNGCAGTVTYPSVVCVTDSPNAAFYPTPDNLTAGNSTATMVNNSSGGSSYLWDFGDGDEGSTLFSPTHTYSAENPGAYTITLIVTNATGCADTATGIIYVEENLLYFVPNAFTPDGDEFNQVFLPVFTSGFDPYDFNFLVMNRWGETIFESNNHEIGWDGSYHGKLVQEGVYTWKIEFKTSKNDERKTILGHLNVLK